MEMPTLIVMIVNKMEKTKLALLGVGDVAQRDYLPEFHRLADRAEIVAACGLREERVKKVVEQYGIPTWYTDYREMLSKTDAEAIINLTPIQIHYETTLASLKSGKHVYSEKPIASTVKLAERLRKEALKHQLILVCAPCVMLFPQVKYVHSLLKNNKIGPVYSAKAYGNMGIPPWTGFMSDPSPFFAKGAGPALDMGVYPLHVLTGLLGPVERVTAMVSKVLDSFTIEEGPFEGKVVPVEAEDNWHVVLDFGHSRLASLTANNCIRGTLAPSVEIYGLNGTVALDPIDVSAPVNVLKVDGEWEQKKIPNPGRVAGPDHHLGIEHLVDCIQYQSNPILNIKNAMHVIEIIEKALKASKEGKTFEISTL